VKITLIKYISARSFFADVPEMMTINVNTNAARLKKIGNIFQHTRNPFAIVM
jgi:hypothetical protein